MELLFELLVTIFLSFIFTTFFIKLFSMNSTNIIDEGKDGYEEFTKEEFEMSKFQWVPRKEDVIKLEECQNEGKSMVEFYKVVGVNTEEKIGDIVTDDGKKVKVALEEENDHGKCQDEGVGVKMEDKIGDIAATDGKKVEINLQQQHHTSALDDFGEFEGKEESDIHNKKVDMTFEDENDEERKMCEIEIECESEKEEIMEDWEEIGIKDFEEIIENE